jgi:hypothetical protein
MSRGRLCLARCCGSWSISSRRALPKGTFYRTAANCVPTDVVISHQRVEMIIKVNYEGTLHVIEGCKAHGVPKLVFASSPSTRFDGSDIDGLTEDQMPKLPQKSYLQVTFLKINSRLFVSHALTPDPRCSARHLFGSEAIRRNQGTRRTGGPRRMLKRTHDGCSCPTPG